MKKDISSSIRELQKEVARKSLKVFATTYFKHYIKCSFADFHLELFDYLTEITLKRGRQLAIAAPRGNAKSSIVSLMYALWCICYGYEKCVVLFSSTRKQSGKLLGHIKDELSSNMELKRDFPEVCEPPNPRWRDDEITTKSGVNVMSSSVEHGIRGIRHKDSRPGLTILDDVESVESIRSQEQREKIYDWFTKMVLNLGSKKSNYIIVGTILHFDSLLAKIILGEEFPGWEKRIYKSVKSFSASPLLWDKWEQIYRGKDLYNEDSGPEVAKKFFEDNKDKMLEGTEVLWPEKESYYELMLMKTQKGNLSFDSEKQNEPKDISGQSIDMKKVIFWEDKHQALEELQAFLGTRKVVLGACDPSIGKGKKSDYSAIVNVFMDYTNKDIYVVDADMGRWDVHTLVERICIHHKTRNFATFLYEANAAQAWLGDIIKKAPTTIPLKPVTNNTPKNSRIMKLIVLIEQGKVKLSRRLSELIRQLEQYPNGAHDDAIDALSMLIDVAENFSRLDVEKIKKIMELVNGLSPEKDPNAFFVQGGKYISNPFRLLKAK
ncbi:MAG: phage terminase large subunit [Candidatus Zapsychrus exili]|nr:phage terminase large subunit [Candidatus Zapsychrus exili]